jgi:hypothetical protein
LAPQLVLNLLEDLIERMFLAHRKNVTACFLRYLTKISFVASSTERNSTTARIKPMVDVVDAIYDGIAALRGFNGATTVVGAALIRAVRNQNQRLAPYFVFQLLAGCQLNRIEEQRPLRRSNRWNGAAVGNRAYTNRSASVPAQVPQRGRELPRRIGVILQ